MVIIWNTVIAAISVRDLRQDSLYLSFWSFSTFFAPWYRRSREASSVKISQKNSKEKLVKCATEVARLHKVSIQSCTQIGRLRKFNCAREIEFKLRLSLWNLAHLFIMFMATKVASDFLIFAWGLSCGLSKSKKNGVKSSPNFERS